MVDFYELAYEIQTQTGGMDSITTVQIQELTGIMDDSTAISLNASNYLELIEQKEIDLLYLEPLPGETQTMAPENGPSNANDEIMMSDKSNSVDFKMYPNPANNEVTVNYDFNESALITIFDITGRIVYTNTLVANRNFVSINLNTISGGTYLVQVQLVDGNKTIKRLVIQ